MRVGVRVRVRVRLCICAPVRVPVPVPVRMLSRACMYFVAPVCLCVRVCVGAGVAG
jgi:hypothetical protein